MKTYCFPKLWVDKWNRGAENIVHGKLRIWNKNAYRWVWFKNPRPATSSLSYLADRERSEYHFKDFIINPVKEGN